MTHQPNKPNPRELERLYRSGGDVEPDPGLDRIISARAEQAAKQGKQNRPARWLGGLATAAALVLAIGVVLRQSPPEQAGLQESLRSPASEAPARHESAEKLSPTLKRQMFSDSSRPSEADEATMATPQQAPSPDALSGAEDTSVEPEPEPAVWLAHIQHLIDRNRLIEAREQLDQLRSQFPETAIPETIEQALARLDND